MPEDTRRAESDAARKDFQERLTAWLDIVLGLLALTLLALLIAELAFSLPEPWGQRVVSAQLAIWAVFVAAFVFELTLAPSRFRYLRENWLVAVSLFIPALRVLRVARALRFLRTARAARTLGVARGGTVLNRGVRELRSFLGMSLFAYILAVTVLFVVTAGALGFFLERDAPDSTITSFPEGVWWAATLITTVNAQTDAVTTEGRIVGLGLRVYGAAVIGYLTAQIAVFFLGRRTGEHAIDLRRLDEKLDRIQAALERQHASLNDAGAPASSRREDRRA